MIPDISKILFYAFLAFQAYVAFFLVLPFFENILALLIGKKKIVPHNSAEENIACVVTGYKDFDIIIPLVDSLLKQNYSNYHIYVVADRCNPDDLVKLNYSGDKVSVFFPLPALNSKVKAIKFAIAHFIGNHSYTLIFDPDNLAHPGFLKTINT